MYCRISALELQLILKLAHCSTGALSRWPVVAPTPHILTCRPIVPGQCRSDILSNKQIVASLHFLIGSLTRQRIVSLAQYFSSTLADQNHFLLTSCRAWHLHTPPAHCGVSVLWFQCYLTPARCDAGAFWRHFLCKWHITTPAYCSAGILSWRRLVGQRFCHIDAFWFQHIVLPVHCGAGARWCWFILMPVHWSDGPFWRRSNAAPVYCGIFLFLCSRTVAPMYCVAGELQCAKERVPWTFTRSAKATEQLTNL